MNRHIRFLFVFTFVAGALAVFAEDPPPVPPKPWRPFPELPEVLFYEGFEGDTHIYETGKLFDGPPAPAGNHVWKLGETRIGNDQYLVIVAHLDQSPLRIPNGIDPKLINIQFMIWVDEPGEVIVWFNHTSGEYNLKRHITAAKSWVPVTLKLSELGAKNARPDASHIGTMFRVFFRTRKQPIPPAYIDNIVITDGVAPAEIAGRLMAAEKKAVELRKRPEKDGYNFTMQYEEILKGALKAAAGKRHNDHQVLIAAPHGLPDEKLDKVFAAAALKSHIAGFTFIESAQPNGTGLGGLEDNRSFIPHALQKADAGWVVLMLSPSDLLQPRSVESVRAVAQRALLAGSIPIVCVPVVRQGATNGEKLKGNIGSVIGICDKLGVPWVEEGFALKGVQSPFDEDDLNAQGAEAITGVAVLAIKHVAESLRK